MIRVKRSISKTGRTSRYPTSNSGMKRNHDLIDIKEKGSIHGDGLILFSRIFLFVMVISALSVVLIFMNSIPGNTGISANGHNTSDRLLPESSLNVTLSDAVISGNINASAYLRNSIFINLVNVTTERDDIIFTFNYTLVLNMSHLCEFGFRFDGVYVDTFDQKVRIDPGKGRRFSLLLKNAPKNYENSIIYSCVVE